MGRKKNTPPIEGTGRNPEDLLVQKSRPLFALWRSDLTLQEFKILDTYLARIDSHQPDKRTVIFEKGELEQLLGVSKINLPQLKERLKHLMGNVVEVGNPKQPKSMHLITLFDEAVAVQDETTGLWEVRLECTQKAMKYCFNIDKIGYLRYKLRGIVALQSRYSYVLFLYLESNRRYKTWTVALDELKATLKCDKEETYKEYKRFNDLILKRCTKEIFEKTDQRFTYEPIKKGRKVVAIKFTLETISDILPEEAGELEGQQQLPWFDEDIDDPLTFLNSACNDEFSREQMDVLLAAIATKDLPPHPDGLEFARYHYLQQQYAMLNVRAAAGKITHRFEYLLKMIQND